MGATVIIHKGVASLPAWSCRRRPIKPRSRGRALTPGLAKNQNMCSVPVNWRSSSRSWTWMHSENGQCVSMVAPIQVQSRPSLAPIRSMKPFQKSDLQGTWQAQPLTPQSILLWSAPGFPGQPLSAWSGARAMVRAGGPISDRTLKGQPYRSRRQLADRSP